MYTIENLKLVLSVASRLGLIASKAFEDGKLGISDVALLPEFVGLFPMLIECDWHQVVPEAKDLSKEEVVALCDHFKAQLTMEAQEAAPTIDINTIISIVKVLIPLISTLIGMFGKK